MIPSIQVRESHSVLVSVLSEGVKQGVWFSIIPESPIAIILLSQKAISFKFCVVPDISFCHVVPPSVVDKIVPESPTIIPSKELRKLMLFKLGEVNVDIWVHEFPALVDWYISPSEPV